MKKFFSYLVVLASFISIANAATTPPKDLPVLDAKKIMLPVGNAGTTISLMDLAYIDVKDFQTLTGKKMSFFDKMGFKTAQKDLRNKMEADGTIKKDVAKKLAKNLADGTTGFHLGGFALGFLVGLIGVLIAYLINDEKKSNRVKWAWIGLAAGIVFYLLLIVALI